MKKFGIDISYAQSKGYPTLFDFEQAKREGVEFVIIRGAQGMMKDDYFEAHYAAAKSAGLAITGGSASYD